MIFMAYFLSSGEHPKGPFLDGMWGFRPLQTSIKAVAFYDLFYSEVLYKILFGKKNSFASKMKDKHAINYNS